MTSRVARIARNTGILYLRMFFVMALSLYTTRVVLHALGFEDYGLYGVVGGVIALAGFLSSSLNVTTQRFLAFEIGKEGRQFGRVFGASVTIHLGLAVAVAIAGEVGGRWLIENHLTFDRAREKAVLWVLHFSVASFAISILRVPFSAVIIAYERLSVFAWLGVAESVLKLAIAIAVSKSAGDRLIMYAGLLLILSVGTLVGFGVSCFSHLTLRDMRPRWDRTLMSAQLGQTTWNLIGSLAGVLSTHGTNVLLNIFFGPAINAARSVALQVHAAVTQFTVNLQTAVTPQITKSYAAEDNRYFNKLIFTGTKLYAGLFAIVGLPVLLEAEFLLELWLGEVPEYTVIFAQLLLVSAYIGTLSNTMQSAVQATGSVKVYQLIVGGMFLLLLPVSWLVLRAGYPPQSVFWVSIVFGVLMLIARVLILSHLINLRSSAFIVGPVLRSLIALVPVMVVGFLIQATFPAGVLRASFIVLVCSSGCALGFYFVALDSGERAVVSSLLRSFVHRVGFKL